MPCLSRWILPLLLLVPGLAAREARRLPVAVWSYRALAGDPAEQEAFFRFAGVNRVRTLYLGAGDLLPGQAGSLGDFIREAGSRGLEVDLVLGRDGWFLPGQRDEALAQVRAALAFTRARRREGWGVPAGLQLDVEPHALPQWDGDRAALAAQYLDFLQAVKAELGGELPLLVAIPVWWSGLALDRGGLTRPLSAWVMVLADTTILMDYRNTPQAILASAKPDLVLAAGLGRRVVLGLDAHCDDGPETPATSFCRKGAAALQRAMARVDRRLRGAPGYGGLAVFTYEDWAALPPGAVRP